MTDSGGTEDDRENTILAKELVEKVTPPNPPPPLFFSSPTRILVVAVDVLRVHGFIDP